MAFKDNRQFIAKLEETGDLVRIKREIDWDMEAGAIVRLSNETRGPATFFENLKDYASNYRILGGPVTTERRLRVAMGFSPDAHMSEVYSKYENIIGHTMKSIITSRAPCKEKVITGKDVNLYDFPAPVVHEGDGGRYIGTWNIVIIRDPDSEWINWGMYRVMIHNRRTLTLRLHMQNDGGRIYHTKYLAHKKPMPVAVVIGADPLSSLVAAIRFNMGVSEVEYAGALHQEPVELVKCETSDLLVPANAEIVLEGEVQPDCAVPEGPFGEFTGYRTEWSYQNVCRVKCITCRKDPILTLVNPGMPLSEGAIGPAMGRALRLKKALKASGVTVTDVYLPPEMAGMVAFVGIKKMNMDNLAAQVSHVIATQGSREQKIIVVDEDVDVFNQTEVFHAFATRLHPGRGITIESRDMSMKDAPFLSTEERKWSRGASVLFDCTWPSDWSKATDIPPKVSFREAYPKELQEKILREWKGKS